MANNRMASSGLGIVIVTLLIAALFDIMPWPEWADWFRPQWVAVVFLYWVLALPDRLGVFAALVVGLFLDAMLNTLFGQHALALVVTTHLLLLTHKRISRLDVLLQAVMMFFFIGIYLWVNYLVQHATGHVALPIYVMLTLALTSAAVWPLVAYAMQLLRRYFLVR